MQARSHNVNCLLPEKRLVNYNLRRGNNYVPTNGYSNKYIQVNTMGIIPLAMIAYGLW